VKIIVTGANGMLGSSLCRLYHDEHDIHAFHRDEKCYTTCSADYSLDLMGASRLQALFSQVKPDLVIHCAGLTSVDACEQEPELAYKKNVMVCENIVRACSNKTKLVYISTDQVYGEARDHSEANQMLQPLNQYGKTKLLGEQKIQELYNNYLILRTNIFGWNIKPGRVSSAEWIYNSLKNKDEITLFSDYTFSPISTVCLGAIIMHLVEIDSSGVINVGSSTPCSKYEFGLLLAVEFGQDTSYIRKGLMSDHSFPAIRSNKLDIDVSKLIEMGIAPPDLRHSMRKFVG
jgi:dTDP-4-dehydrorhamnose reductase